MLAVHPSYKCPQLASGKLTSGRKICLGMPNAIPDTMTEGVLKTELLREVVVIASTRLAAAVPLVGFLNISLEQFQESARALNQPV
jgi:hypothetical protein